MLASLARTSDCDGMMSDWETIKDQHQSDVTRVSKGKPRARERESGETAQRIQQKQGKSIRVRVCSTRRAPASDWGNRWRAARECFLTEAITIECALFGISQSTFTLKQVSSSFTNFSYKQSKYHLRSDTCLIGKEIFHNIL